MCRGYELREDLDVDGIDWQPIGDENTPFEAIFEGNGNIISNLSIMKPTEQYVGFFGYTTSGSIIRTTSLLNVNIVGTKHVGSLVGKNDGNINSSYAKGSVEEGTPANDSNIGGLVGENTGTINTSYVDVDVAGDGNASGADKIGGFVGIQNNNGTIENSYARGDVSNKNTQGSGSTDVGGFVGENNTGTIQFSYAANEVTGLDAEGFCGDIGTSIVFRSYWDTKLSGSSSICGEGKTTEELQQEIIGRGIYQTWSTDHWFGGSSQDYPVLLYANTDPENPSCGEIGQPECGEPLGDQRITTGFFVQLRLLLEGALP